jgi:hypothetical protein
MVGPLGKRPAHLSLGQNEDQMVRIAVVCLVVSYLAACANNAVPVNTPVTSTPSPIPLPTNTQEQSETEQQETLYEAGKAEFVRRVIDIGEAAVAAADFDQDGHADLISAGEPQLTIFRGDGEGGLASFSRAPGGEHPVDFAIADLNEDGNLDVAVANHDTDYLTILNGDGDGNFKPAANSPLIIDVRPHPHAVQAVDLDGDGHIDLVVDHREAQGLLILRGLGDGDFESPGKLVDGGGDPYRGMAIGDINGDGKPDLVTPNPSEVGVLVNTSSEQIAFRRVSPVAAEAPFAVALGDFNGDGDLDLLAASDEGSSRVELFLGDGNAGFEPAIDSPFQAAPGAKKIVVGDFTGDGVQDAVVSSYQSADLLVLIGGSDIIQTGFLPADEHPWGLAAADFNHDGRDDLVVADDKTKHAVIYLSYKP